MRKISYLQSTTTYR